jgi:hypothetical protein
MSRKPHIALFWILVGGLLFSSCRKEYFDLDKLSTEMELETDLVAPLIHGSMVMGDLVLRLDSTGYVGEFDDGLIFVAYDTFAEVIVDSLDLVIDGLYQEMYFSLDVGDDPVFLSSAIDDTIHFQKSKYFTFETAGDTRLDSIVFKGGEMLTELESTFLHSGFITISSEYILDLDRNPYSNTMTISDASGSFSLSQSQDLDGYYLKTEKQGDSSVFRIDYDLALINSGNSVESGDFCEISTSFLDLGFYSLFGFIDPGEMINERGDVDIPIFSDVPELSHLKLADPRISIFMESSMGLPFLLEMDSVIATADDGSTETLVFTEGHPFKIASPTIDQVGETVSTDIEINNQTSNIQDLLNIAPSSLSYHVMGGVDLDYTDSHFLLDTSRLKVETEFLIPLDFKFTHYTLQDTLGFEMGEEGIDTTLVREVRLRVGTVNELPLELGLQLYFMDEAHVVFDSVFNGVPIFLSASSVDGEGRLLTASENENVISFPPSKLGLLKDVRFIQVVARMVTAASGEEFVKIYSDYSLDFEISMYASFNVNTSEL